jgi:hypothetical protein
MKSLLTGRIGIKRVGTFSARLRAGDISYRLGPGRFKCPWCNRKEMPSDFLGMYQHVTYIGVGSGQTTAHIRAKHAAYGLFLKKYAPRQ